MDTEWKPVLNTTAEIIPPGGLMRVSAEMDSETGAFKVAKPNADSDTKVMVNSLAAIPAFNSADLPSSTGQGTFGPAPIIAYEPADGLPAVGETWGAKSGSWLAGKGKTGFAINGGAGLGLVNAVRQPAASSAASPVAVDYLTGTYYTSPTSAGNSASIPSFIVAGVSNFSWAGVLGETEIIIPAGSGLVWLEGQLSASHSGSEIAGGAAANLYASLQGFIWDLDLNAALDTNAHWFASGQIINGAPSKGFGTYVNGTTFYGEAKFGMIVDATLKRRFAFQLGLNLAHPTGANLSLNYGIQVSRAFGNTYLKATQIPSLTTTTPDFTALTGTATQSATSGAHALSVNFTATPSGGVSTYSYRWYYGDGPFPDTTQNPTHSYAAAGTYRPYVIVTDSVGQTAVVNLTAIVVS